LPHFDGGAVVQAITFRLADSIPRKIYDELVAVTKSDPERQSRTDHLIDEGRGACLLKHPENAAIVRATLQYFDGERYRLLAWVIMPNHVHTLIEQVDGYPLGDIVHSWKSFAAKRINTLRKSNGPVWAPDYYDRFVRNEEHYANAVQYIENNPVKAGLARTSRDWEYSSATKHV
jgi:REP element-mobilizing transposase RayT